MNGTEYKLVIVNREGLRITKKIENVQTREQANHVFSITFPQFNTEAVNEVSLIEQTEDTALYLQFVDLAFGRRA